jgi:glycosyltransferase involved in cell wall biosynthesis
VLKYSVVIPLLNEEQSIPELYARLKAVMERTGEPFESIFVDDGSTDRTFQLLKEIANADSRVTVIKLRHHFGKTAALAAGFEHAQGEYIISMDGDLQHDPEDIPRFLERLKEGYDVVCGWRTHRSDNLWLRQVPSRCANWLMARLSGVKIHDFGGGFKAYRRDLIKEVPLYGELQRFIPALASSYGATVGEIPIRNIPRPYGASHYGISRVVPVLFDLISVRFLLVYLSRPMHFFGLWGLLISLGGFGIAGWLLAQRLLYNVQIMMHHGPLLIFSAVLILAGLQLLAMGLLGEMQVRLFHEFSRRAHYSIDRVVTANKPQQCSITD